MRLAIMTTAERAVGGLAESAEIVLCDSESGATERLPSPARQLTAGRRLAVVDLLLERGVDVVCAVPGSFCPLSYAVARAGGLRFLPVEAGTPLALIADHGAALATAARPDLPAGWVANTPAEPAPEPLASPTSPLSDATARALINRLKRVEGQARGVRRLIEERRSHDEILVQLSAMRSALNAVAVALLTEHLAACLADAGQPDRVERLDAARRAFRILNS